MTIPRHERPEAIRKNPSERGLESTARAAGWKVTKRGWPDFFCWRDGVDGKREIMMVEVKPLSKSQPGRYQRPTKAQMQTLTILHDAGFDVRISDGSDMGVTLPDALMTKENSPAKKFDGIRRSNTRRF